MHEQFPSRSSLFLKFFVEMFSRFSYYDNGPFAQYLKHASKHSLFFTNINDKVSVYIEKLAVRGKDS